MSCKEDKSFEETEHCIGKNEGTIQGCGCKN